jgi:endogenous inhibitor of DNA gyrase (YacG/DUF329 family)
MAKADTTDRRSAEVVPLRRRGKCPICGKPSDREMHPFCSRRCAEVDLNRWLSGSYAIPAAEEEPGGEEGGGGDETA